MRRGCCTFLVYMEGRVRSSPSFRRRLIEPMEDQSQGRLHVYVHLVALPEAVVLRSQTALTVILLGFNNGRAGRMAAYARRVAELSWCGELRRGSMPRRPPPWLPH